MADTSLTYSIFARDRTGPAMNSVASSFSRVGGLGKKMFAGLAVGGAALVAGGAVLGKQMIDIASDTAEAQSKVGVVFGKSAAEINKFAETSAASYGISKKSALGYTSAIGAVATAQGASKKEAADLGLTYTKLAADMASFGNTSIEEAAEALTNSVTGEFEMMKKYGVVINDGRLAQEALAQGIKKTGSTWTAAQKQQLSYSIIMKDTALAQGDFGRTSGGLANQQRILSAKLEDLKGTMGEKLLPVAVKVVGAIIKLIDGAKGFANAIKPVTDGIKVFFNAISGKSELGEFSGGLGKANNAGVKISQWIRNDFLPTAKRFVSWFRNEAIPAIKKFAMDLWASLQPAIASISKGLREQVIPAMRNLIAKFKEAWPSIQRFATVIGNVAKFVLTKVVPVLASLSANVMGRLIRVFGTAFAAVWKFVGVLISVGAAVGKAGAAFGRFVSAVSGAIGRAWSAVKTGVGNIVKTVSAFPGKALRAIGNLAGMLKQHGLDFIQGFINGIIDKAASIPGIIKDKVVGVAKSALHGFGLFGSASRLTMKYGKWWTEGFAIGMKDKAADVVAKAKEMVDKLKEKLAEVKDFAKEIKSAFVDAGNVTSLDVGEDTSFAGMLSKLQAQAAAARAFASGMATLRKRGLNEMTLSQLREAGPTGGAQAVQTLLTGDVAAINAAAADLRRTGEQFGNAEAKNKYGIDPSKQKTLTINLNLSGADEDLLKKLRKQIRIQGGDVVKVLGG